MSKTILLLIGCGFLLMRCDMISRSENTKTPSEKTEMEYPDEPADRIVIVLKNKQISPTSIDFGEGRNLTYSVPDIMSITKENEAQFSLADIEKNTIDFQTKEPYAVIRVGTIP